MYVSTAVRGSPAPTDFEILDPRFDRLVNATTQLERLFTGCRWTEGPAYFPASRCLLWSDLPNNRILRYDEEDGHVSVFRKPSNYANGNTVDRQGRLVTCEHLGRRVTRTEHDGRVTVIASAWQGKRLNSPNDVVVRSDGSI
jgi:gluconolactonase